MKPRRSVQASSGVDSIHDSRHLEVQTYFHGVTFGGHKVADVEKLRQQKLGWELLIGMVKQDTFSLTKETACTIQGVLGLGEALDRGSSFGSGRHRRDRVQAAQGERAGLDLRTGDQGHPGA
jgi:hypothetical protein